MNIETILASHRLLSLLKPAARRELAAHCHVEQFAKGDVIYHEGGAATRVWCVLSGQVKAVKIGRKGHELLIELVVAQELFGAVFYAECPRYPCTAVAMEATRVLHFPVAEMHTHLGRNAALQKQILADICIRLCHAQHMRGLAVEDVPQRIGGALLYLLDKFGRDVPHTRATLAELAGTTVESAIRVTRRLSQRGIIATKRGGITILSPERLAQFADEV